MTSSHLNVFEGSNSLLDYYDPDKNVPTPLVEIHGHPFAEDNVRIFAKLMSFLPATNVKSLPALNMLMDAKESGQYSPSRTQTVVEYSSGSTIISLGILSRLYGVPDVHAYLSNKTSQAKLDLLRFFGLRLTLFGGASQPEPLDPYGGIYAAAQQGTQEGWFNPDQYSNPANPGAHERWTGPQIMKQLPSVNVFAASMGTSGTMTGTGMYLKKVKPSMTRVGVCTAPGERVPGPRTYSLLAPVEFPWREAISCYEEIGTKESFVCSLDLCRHGILAGPSSGLALRGLLKFLQRRKDEGPEALDALRGPEGRIDCVFICSDLPFQYISEYMQHLGEEYFPPIENSELIGYDSYPYRPEWELAAKDIASHIEREKGNEKETEGTRTLIMDIRKLQDYEKTRIAFPHSINVDIGHKGQLNPFRDAQTLAQQWSRLNEKLGPQNKVLKGIHPWLDDKQHVQVICVCYDGHTAKIATSILRARGVVANYVLGGYEKWVSEALPLETIQSPSLIEKIRKLFIF